MVWVTVFAVLAVGARGCGCVTVAGCVFVGFVMTALVGDVGAPRYVCVRDDLGVWRSVCARAGVGSRGWVCGRARGVVFVGVVAWLTSGSGVRGYVCVRGPEFVSVGAATWLSGGVRGYVEGRCKQVYVGCARLCDEHCLW